MHFIYITVIFLQLHICTWSPNDMLEYLEPYMYDTNPRIIPAWTQYVSALEVQANILLKRFILGTDHETAGIALLRYILACVDWNYMLRQDSDYDKYIYYARFIRRDLQNTFDNVSSGYLFHNLFTQKNLTKIPEFIIPAEDIIPTTYLPFDKPWEYWASVRPVRYLVHDSPELALNVEQDRVKFYKYPPNHVVISIDVIALIFKYMKYLQADDFEYDVTSGERIGKDQRRFLHKFVLFGFIRDQIDTFLVKQLLEVWDINDKDELKSFTTSNRSTDLQFGFVGLRYTDSCRVLFNEFEKMKAGNIRPSAMFATKLLSYNTSLIDRVNVFLNRVEVPILRQYQFYRVLRDKELFTLFIKMHDVRSTIQGHKQICRILRPKIQSLIRQRVWTYTSDVVCKSIVENTLQELLELLATY